MKIVFVNRFFTPDHSATSQLLGDLCQNLNLQQCEVHVVTSRMIHTDPRQVLQQEQRIGAVTVHRVWTTRFGRGGSIGRGFDYLTFYVHATLALLSLVRRGDVIVAKTDPPLISVPAAAVAMVRRAALVNWLQDLFPEVAVKLGALPSRGPIGALLQGLRNWSLRRAVCNVAIGASMRRLLLELGIDRRRIRCLANWSSGVDMYGSTSAARALQSDLGRADDFVAMYSGNLGRAHDYSAFLGAAIALAGHTDILFVFIGSGTGMDALRAAASSRGLRNIVFLPHRPKAELGTSLAAADVHLITLLPELEGLIVPSKLYGVLAAGRPSIFVGDVNGEVGRLLAAKECGLSLAPGDGRGLADCLLKLRDDRTLRMRMGGNARVVYEVRFTLEHAVRGWRGIVCKLIAAGGTP